MFVLRAAIVAQTAIIIMLPAGKKIKGNLLSYAVLFTTLLLESFVPAITTFLPQFFS